MFSSRSRVSALAVLSFFRTAPALAADVGTWFGNPATTWQAGGSTSPVPAAVTTFANTTGTSFTCHYANVVDPTPGQFGRCAWDTTGGPAMSIPAAPLTLWVHITGAANISNLTLFFESGTNAYYIYDVTTPLEGWNRVDIDRATLIQQGINGSSSFDNIRWLRVSPWKNEGGPNGTSTLFITAQSPPIAIPSDLPQAFSPASDAWHPRGVGSGEATPVSTSHGDGAQVVCDLTQTPALAYYDNRQTAGCRWDITPLAMNLSAAGSITGWVYVSGADAIDGVSLTLDGPTGRYYRWKSYPLYEGWNRFNVSRRSFHHVRDNCAEGVAIDEWNNIRSLSLTVPKLKNKEVTLQFVDFHTNSSTADESPFEIPLADQNLPRPRVLDAQGRLREDRLLADEAPFFVGNISRTLDIVEQAGFNIYAPNVWHGMGAVHASTHAPVTAGYQQATTQLGKDPLAELIRQAHARGIEVHPWFNVSLRQSASLFPQWSGEPQYDGGLPPGGSGSFDMWNPAFRDFIVEEMVSVARDYDIDGITFDYIRTQGTKLTASASQQYRDRYDAGIQELVTHPLTQVVLQRSYDWQAWPVDDVVQRVSTQVRALKPHLLISVDGLPLPAPLRSNEGRNDREWLEKSWVDRSYAMDYAVRPWFPMHSLVREQLGKPGNAVILGNYDDDPYGCPPDRPGVRARDPQAMADQIEYSLRKLPGVGAGVYIMSLFDPAFFPSSADASVQALAQGPFKEKALPYERLPFDGGLSDAGFDAGSSDADGGTAKPAPGTITTCGCSSAPPLALLLVATLPWRRRRQMRG